tara:strand:- start:289 stop:417 length:129 start_codon:yes stop_codon:yes gene_type:complete
MLNVFTYSCFGEFAIFVGGGAILLGEVFFLFLGLATTATFVC